MTPAQQRGLALLAQPGAVAHSARGVRWRVIDEQTGIELGTIHAESLFALRALDLVAWIPATAEHDDTQRITTKGREYMAAAEMARASVS